MPHSWENSVCNSFNSASVSGTCVAIVVVDIRSSVLPLPAGSELSFPSAGWNRVNRFSYVVQATKFAALQNFIEIQEDDQAPAQFPDAGDVVQLAFLKDVLWGFDFRGRDTQNLGRRIHHQSNQAVL